MKMFKQLAASLAAATLAVAPVATSAAPLADLRAASTTSDENELRGGFIIPLIAVLAVILGILAATSGGSDRPTSP